MVANQVTYLILHQSSTRQGYTPTVRGAYTPVFCTASPARLLTTMQNRQSILTEGVGSLTLEVPSHRGLYQPATTIADDGS
jgi:hypothetical protein